MNHKIKMNYYDTFRCTADACPMSCCQQWRIGVDEETFEKWKGLDLCEHVKCDDAGNYIKLDGEKKCPYLNEKQLCQLVMEHGEDILSVTCTNFPRRINEFEDHMEFSLDTGCPAVVDLLLQVKGQIIQEGEVRYKENPELFKVRAFLLKLIEMEKYSLNDRLKMGFYTLLDFLEGQKKLDTLLAIYQDDSELMKLARAIEKVKDNPVDTFWERNELFLDMTTNYRYQKLYVSYIEPIAKVAEGLEKQYTNQEIQDKINYFEIQFNRYELLMQQYIQAELLGGCILTEMTFEEMVIAYEWIALAYAILKQAVFLKWHLEGEGEVTYEMVRDYICITSRVTGYGMDDIKDYMENSFESSIWEWGYLALIVGR